MLLSSLRPMRTLCVFWWLLFIIAILSKCSSAEEKAPTTVSPAYRRLATTEIEAESSDNVNLMRKKRFAGLMHLIAIGIKKKKEFFHNLFHGHHPHPHPTPWSKYPPCCPTNKATQPPTTQLPTSLSPNPEPTGQPSPTGPPSPTGSPGGEDVINPDQIQGDRLPPRWAPVPVTKKQSTNSKTTTVPPNDTGKSDAPDGNATSPSPYVLKTGTLKQVPIATGPPAEEDVAQMKADLDATVVADGESCGRVPIYEKHYKRSINESFVQNPDAGDFRIIGGLDSVRGEWPWITRIEVCKTSEDCGTCTGTLLSDRWIITAGHCMTETSPERYSVTFGLYDLVSPDSGSFSAKVDLLVLHPQYENLENDLLLLRLSKPVKMSDTVQAACLIHSTRNVRTFTKYRTCYNVGYGLTDGMVNAIKLQKLPIVTKTPSECNSDRLGSVQLKRGTVCIGPPDGKKGSSCKGDSGGPDLCYDPTKNRWVIFGTVSYGPANCDRDEGESWLTVSVDLSNYRTWILDTMKSDSQLTAEESRAKGK